MEDPKSCLLDLLLLIQNTSRFVYLKMMRSLKKIRKRKRQILSKFYRLLDLLSNNNKYSLMSMVMVLSTLARLLPYPLGIIELILSILAVEQILKRHAKNVARNIRIMIKESMIRMDGWKSQE